MPAELLEIGKIGGPLVLLLLLIGWWGLTKKWVFGWTYEQEQERHKEEIAKRDAEIKRWQDLALDLGGMADFASRQAIVALQESKRAAGPARPKRGASHDPPPA
jgi:hypothetical protein